MNNSSEILHRQQNDGILPDITMYGALIWAPLGFILNTLSLVILIKCKDFSSSIGNYLKSLCVADNILIVVVCVHTDNHWQNTLSILQINNLNDVACKFSIYIGSVGFLSTGLILASATFERFLIVAFPLKFWSSNSGIISKVLIGSYFILALAVSAVFAVGAGITAEGQCWVKGEYENMVIIAYLVAHVIISNVLCGGAILIFTIAIIICLFRQRRKRHELTNSSSNSQKEFQITVMLLTVTCLFIILRFPEMIFAQISLVYPEIYIKVESWSMIFILLILINHSINFFVYLIFLESFRKTFLTMFLSLCCFWRRKQKRETMENTRRVGDLGIQKSKSSSCSIIEARENTLKVFTIETEN